MIRIVAILFLGSASVLIAQTQTKSKPQNEITDYFSRTKVANLTIAIGPKELESLRKEPRKYVKATLKEDDKNVVFKDVGIHVKGAAGSTRSIDDKPGLTIDLNRFVEDQSFHGMDKFHLANSVQDPSYVTELICGELFRAAGVPASRIGHAVVTINGKNRGLYYVKEGYDKNFVNTHFKTIKGNLYDGGFLTDIDQPLHQLRGKGDVKDHADLKALVEAAHEQDLKVRFQKLEKLLDMDKFMAFLVLETITWDWDGYPMHRNNYRIYHDPGLNKIIFFPSGMDQMFGNPGGPILPNLEGMIASRVMETPQGRARYFEKMDFILKKVYRPEEICKRIDELQKRLQLALVWTDEGAGKDYPQVMNNLKNAVRERGKNLREQLRTIRR